MGISLIPSCAKRGAVPPMAKVSTSCAAWNPAIPRNEGSGRSPAINTLMGPGPLSVESICLSISSGTVKEESSSKASIESEALTFSIKLYISMLFS